MNLAVSPPPESVNLWIDSLSVVVPKNSVFILSVLTLNLTLLYSLNDFLFKPEKMLMKRLRISVFYKINLYVLLNTFEIY